MKNNILDQSGQFVSVQEQNLFKNACRISTRFLISRYLLSNTDGRLDGAEKATRHQELCEFYVASVLGLPDPDLVRRRSGLGEDLYQAVHEKTQDLTDYLDEVIGFPLKGKPDHDVLEPLFFDKFHELAMSVLAPHVGTDHSPPVVG